MKLLKGTTRLQALVVVLFAATAGAATRPRHPPVAAGAVCVTRECHAQLLEPTRGAGPGSVHQPAADGECDSCHDLALSAAARYVRVVPAGENQGTGNARAWDVALCSGCHADVLAAKDAAAGTARFADGGRNLHTLHVLAGRGRRCLNCHDPHRSRQLRLLRERIPARGDARITQQFREEPEGGWCKTGCHAPKAYKR